MRRDSRQADNFRPTGTRVQHRVTARRGVIVANPAGLLTVSDFFVTWDDDSSTTGAAPRNLAPEFHIDNG